MCCSIYFFVPVWEGHGNEKPIHLPSSSREILMGRQRWCCFHPAMRFMLLLRKFIALEELWGEVISGTHLEERTLTQVV